MPLGPDEIGWIAAALAALFGGSGYTVGKLQSPKPPASSGAEDGGEVLRAIHSVSTKVDLMNQTLSSVNYKVNGVATDVDEAKQDIVRLKRLEPQIEDIHGRLVVLESRSATNQARGQI